MRPRLSPQTSRAFTAVEAIVILFVIAVFVVFLLPKLKDANAKAKRIHCVSRQKQIGLAYKIWAGDNHGVFPMDVSITNGGSKEDVLAGRPLSTFLVMSNELATPLVIWCPNDLERWPVDQFSNLTVSNLSYFVSADMTNNLNPQAVLSGDRQFELRGRPVRPGLAAFGTNDSVTWSPTTGHKNFGSVSLADGSVQCTTSESLAKALQQTGMATNRFALP